MRGEGEEEEEKEKKEKENRKLKPFSSLNYALRQTQCSHISKKVNVLDSKERGEGRTTTKQELPCVISLQRCLSLLLQIDLI